MTDSIKTLAYNFWISKTHPMTSATKHIWKVKFHTPGREIVFREQLVAAWNLSEVLTYFNAEAQNTIIEITKQTEQITYYYPWTTRK